MAAGIRIRETGTGRMILDTSDRIGTILGTIDIGQYDGAIDVPELGRPNARGFYTINSIDVQYYVRQPIVRFVNEDGVWRMRWTWRNGGSAYNTPCRVSYGVY